MPVARLNSYTAKIHQLKNQLQKKKLERILNTYSFLFQPIKYKLIQGIA